MALHAAQRGELPLSTIANLLLDDLHENDGAPR
jgi:hypothetical protein